MSLKFFIRGNIKYSDTKFEQQEALLTNRTSFSAPLCHDTCNSYKYRTPITSVPEVQYLWCHLTIKSFDFQVLFTVDYP